MYIYLWVEMYVISVLVICDVNIRQIKLNPIVRWLQLTARNMYEECMEIKCLGDFE